MQKPDMSRLPSLDGWRAIAIVLVLLSHWWGAQGAEQIPPSFAPIQSHGDLGVRIFLVISGLLITFLLLKEKDRCGEINLKRFYIRRALRIFPVYFAFLGVLGFMSVLGYYHDEPSTWMGALTFTRNFVGRGDSATGHLWSLAVEEQFYLLWPICLISFRLNHRPRIALCIFVAVVLAALAVRLFSCSGDGFVCTRLFGPKSLLRYMDSLAIGCAAAFLLWRARAKIPALGFWPSSVALVVATAINTEGLAPVEVVVTLQSFIAAAAILCSIAAAPAVLNNRLMASVGVLSYSIYIWHTLFIANFIKASDYHFILDWRVWFIPVACIAALSYHLMEKPLNTLRRHFSHEDPAIRTA